MSTVQRDLEMVVPILKARGERESERLVRDALANLTTAYELMLASFGASLVESHSARAHFHDEIGITR